MAWQPKVAATQLTSITSTEQFFSFGGNAFIGPTNPRELLALHLDVLFSAGTTDDAVVTIYGTLDDASESWETVGFPYQMGRVSSTHVTQEVFLSGYYKFRVGVKRSGTTDTLTTADCSYRRDGVNA